MIKKENLWIALTWIIVFLFILAWDQEKIVVVNLVIFCYFIYYLVGDSIETSLAQRQTVLLETLLVDLNSNLRTLRNLVEESQVVTNTYKILFLSIIKKVLNTSLASFINLSDTTSALAINFNFVQLALSIYSEQAAVISAYQNLYVVNQVIEDSASTLFINDNLDSSEV
jgi:hypothetical protein